MKIANKAVNSDAFFVRCAHYKCAGYGGVITTWNYRGYFEENFVI